MEMKIVGITVAILVSITVLAGVLMPVLEDATATTDTFTNEGYYDMTYSLTDNVTLTWDHTTPKKLTVNDVVLDAPEIPEYNARTVMCGDGWLIRLGNSPSQGGYNIQYSGPGGTFILASPNNELDLSVTCTGGTATITDTASTPNTATQSYTYIYCIATDGDYVMKNANEDVYINSDTELYGMGISNIGSVAGVGIKVYGTIDDGLTWSSFTSSGFVFTDSAINYTEVSDHVDLYKLSSLTCTATRNSDTSDLVYNYIIVPAEVTAERSVHFTDNQNALFAVIPMLVIVAILIGVVALVIRSRLD